MEAINKRGSWNKGKLVGHKPTSNVMVGGDRERVALPGIRCKAFGADHAAEGCCVGSATS